MINVTSYTNSNGKIIGFLTSGHAEYDVHGQDIICSAISALIINTMNSIEQFTSDTFEYKDDEKTGVIDFKIVSDLSDKSDLLLQSLFLGLQGIQNDYGKKYIQFDNKEII